MTRNRGEGGEIRMFEKPESDATNFADEKLDVKNILLTANDW